MSLVFNKCGRLWPRIIRDTLKTGVPISRVLSSPISFSPLLGVCAVLAAQLWLTLCHPMDWSPPGSSVGGILQARILDWVAFPPPGDLPDPGIEPGSPAS